MPVELKRPVSVRLDRLYLDPNNPRLALADKPGYANPAKFLDAATQERLTNRLRDSYKGIRDLIKSILSVGWLPVDPMLAWEIPRKKGHFVVLEGNTRTTALRLIRRDFEKEKRRLAKFKKNAYSDPVAVQDQEEVVAAYAAVVKATETIEVSPVAASGPAELAYAVPRLLGVRHITHAQQWKPHATNFYVYTIYRQVFDNAYGSREGLKLEEPLLRQTADLVSLNAYKVRKAVQIVLSFNHFRSGFEDRLPKGESFRDDDQNYFAALLEPGYAREQFRIGHDDLWLSGDMEEVLFQWGFSKPRGEDEDENLNILRSADDLRIWNRMARYDDRAQTRFARQIDVARPRQARRVTEVEREWLVHRVDATPVETMRSLLQNLKQMEVETIRAHHAEIRPAMNELAELVAEYQAILEAIETEQGRPERVLKN
jgi:hypothetical protein